MKKALLVIGTILVSERLRWRRGGQRLNPPTSPPIIVVTLSPSGAISLDAGQTVKFGATVENDSGAKGVTWSCSTGSSAGATCGTFSDATTSGATYNAPASTSTNLTVTVTATSIRIPPKATRPR